MKSPGRLREKDLEAIRDAVAAAEQETSGEIVTYVVGECDDYPDATWRGAALGALLGMALGLGLHGLLQRWSSPAWWMLAAGVVGLLVGMFLASTVAPLRRRLIRPDLLTLRVGLRAESAFLEEEVFDTRERTGILLFVALFEHRVVVLGDAGINAAVAQEDWQEIIDHMVEELRAGRPAEALARGVRDCGRLLARSGVEIRADDVDELSNEPRLRDR